MKNLIFVALISAALSWPVHARVSEKSLQLSHMISHLTQGGEYSKALKLADRSIEQSKSSVDRISLMRTKSSTLEKMGRLDELIELNKIILSVSESKDSWNYSRAARDLEEFGRKLSFIKNGLQQVIEQSGEATQAHEIAGLKMKRARLLAKLGKHAEALGYMDSGFNILYELGFTPPDNWFYLRLNSYNFIEDVKGAIEITRSLVGYYPTLENRRLFAIILSRHEPARAESYRLYRELYQIGALKEKGGLENYLLMVSEFESPQMAIKQFEQAFESGKLTKKGVAETYYYDALIKNKEYSRVREKIGSIRNRYDRAALMPMVAKSYFEEGDYKKAIKSYKRLLPTAVGLESKVRVQALMAKAYYMLGKPTKARKQLDRASKLLPENELVLEVKQLLKNERAIGD